MSLLERDWIFRLKCALDFYSIYGERSDLG
jgi:hypothetical protein